MGPTSIMTEVAAMTAGMSIATAGTLTAVTDAITVNTLVAASFQLAQALSGKFQTCRYGVASGRLVGG